MSIEFACTACGRRIKAPEELAGKKARCPQCQAVVEVPPQVLEAELAPPAAITAAPTDGGLVPEPMGGADGGDEARRPCPMCGELIVATAVKCRYCGEIFDEVLRGKRDEKSWIDQQFADTSMLVLVVAPLCCNLFALIFAVVGVATCQHPTARRNAFILLAISIVWIAVWFLISLTGTLENPRGGFR